MKKFLVTGATGFIGNYVIKELIQKGFEVVASSSHEQTAATKDWFDKVQYVPFDMQNFDAAKDYFKYFNEPDALIHLAWEGLPNYTNDFHVTENLPRHKQFLKNILTSGLNSVTITGTCLEYGLREGCLKESMAANPSNAYAIAKNELRIYLEQISGTLKKNFKWLRLFYMFGKGQNPNSLFAQLDAAIESNAQTFNMSGGKQIRDFLPIESVANYIVLAAVQNNTQGIINCCSGEPSTVLNLVKAYLKTRGKDINLNLGYYSYPTYEPMVFWGDRTRLNEVIQSFATK